MSQTSQNKSNDLKRAFTEDGAHKTHIGGQALIEGVMMRGKHNWAVGVRQEDGNLYSKEYPLSKKGSCPAWFSWPIVRGCVAFVDSLVLGYKALEVGINAAFTFDDEDDDEPQEQSDARGAQDDEPQEQSDARGAQDDEPQGAFSKFEMGLSLVLGLVLGIALFIFFPALAANVLVGNYEEQPLVWNIVDGIMRVAIFVFYVWLIGRMKDIKRMFSYHGAEHKTIHCYEHGLELTPENAKQFPRLHVRCGTAFLIMVMIIAILVYTIVPLNALIAALGITGIGSFIFLLLIRIALLPLIAGISYEITVKWAGSHPDNKLVRIVLWPGMQMQRLTTNEPDDGMLECAIAAMKLVVEREQLEHLTS